MEVEIKPTEKIKVLKQNLEKRVKDIEQRDDKIIVETEDPSKLDRIPGIEIYTVESEKKEGIKGSPVDQPVYARLESKKDAVRCLLATIQGYDLRILDTGREWDLRQLKRYNPDIKHLKTDEPVDALQIDQAISEVEGVKKIEVDAPECQEKIDEIYRGMLT